MTRALGELSSYIFILSILKRWNLRRRGESQLLSANTDLFEQTKELRQVFLDLKVEYIIACNVTYYLFRRGRAENLQKRNFPQTPCMYEYFGVRSPFFYLKVESLVESNGKIKPFSDTCPLWLIKMKGWEKCQTKGQGETLQTQYSRARKECLE